MALPPLLDAGSIAAILVAIDRGAARYTMLRSNRTMTDNQTPAVDPYAGARAMGITVPAPVPAEAPAAQETGETDADYAAYLKWRDSQKSASVTVTPAAEAPEAATPIGAYLGADVTAAENTAEAVTQAAAEAPVLPAAGPVQTPLSGKLRGIASDVIDVIQALEAAEE